MKWCQNDGFQHIRQFGVWYLNFVMLVGFVKVAIWGHYSQRVRRGPGSICAYGGSGDTVKPRSTCLRSGLIALKKWISATFLKGFKRCLICHKKFQPIIISGEITLAHQRCIRLPQGGQGQIHSRKQPTLSTRQLIQVLPGLRPVLQFFYLLLVYMLYLGKNFS